MGGSIARHNRRPLAPNSRGRQLAEEEMQQLALIYAVGLCAFFTLFAVTSLVFHLLSQWAWASAIGSFFENLWTWLIVLCGVICVPLLLGYAILSVG